MLIYKLHVLLDACFIHVISSFRKTASVFRTYLLELLIHKRQNHLSMGIADILLGPFSCPYALVQKHTLTYLLASWKLLENQTVALHILREVRGSSRLSQAGSEEDEAANGEGGSGKCRRPQLRFQRAWPGSSVLPGSTQIFLR